MENCSFSNLWMAVISLGYRRGEERNEEGGLVWRETIAAALKIIYMADDSSISRDR